MDVTLPAVGILLLLVLLSALFSALETALFSLGSAQRERLKAEAPNLGSRLESLLAHPRRLLSALLLADACVNVPLLLVALFLLQDAGEPWSRLWVGPLLLFPLLVLLCDLLPKVVAWMKPLGVVRHGLPPAFVFLQVLQPAARLLHTACERAATRLLPAALQPNLFLSEEELETLVQLGAEEGSLSPHESEIIQQIMKLRGKTVRDCMTPRIDLRAISDDLTRAEVLAEMRRERHRRVPVYGETPDDIVGILETRAFLDEPERPYTELMVPPSFVPETMRALDLLRSFLRHPQGMAVIVDEYGGIEGVITLADLVEEILGDAFPSGEHELYIETQSPGELLVSGQARLEDLREYINLEAEAEGVDTINGLIFHELGYVPRKGAQFRLGGHEVTVRRVSRKRVEELVIQCQATRAPDLEEHGG